MFEISEASAAAEAVEDLDAAGVLRSAVASRDTADQAEARMLQLAAHWADLHAVLPVGTGSGTGSGGGAARVVVPGMQRLVRLAGEGTPEVAEFAPAELGAALRMSSFAASCLVGDALELRHRLPRLWARVLEGSLPAWRARKIADATKILPADAAAWVDAQMVAFAHRIGIRRVLDLVAVALWRFDPAEAKRRAEAARQGRGVFLGAETHHGTRSVTIEADALDVASFDATITAIAAALAGLGDTDRDQLRRAKAIGVIADPQGTLDLLGPEDPATDHGTDHDEAGDTEFAGDAASSGDDDESGASGAGRGGDAGHGSGAPSRASSRALSRAQRPVLYLHLHADALATHGPDAIGRLEGGGPVAAAQIIEWLGRADLRIQPVLDLAETAAVDAYEAPARIRETVLLRNPCCPFPWCNNLSRTKDLDHITAYTPPEDGGPPGQTGAGNLAAVCRTHHRTKTHGGWSYTMPEPGIYLWRSPHGHRYLVDHTGTTNLAPPPAPAEPDLPKTA